MAMPNGLLASLHLTHKPHMDFVEAAPSVTLEFRFNISNSLKSASYLTEFARCLN